MKIVAIACVLNEEKNIIQFCEGYSFCDQILIADGGSWDDTRILAGQFENVKVIDTSEFQIPTPDDPHAPYRTSEPHQTNVLIKRAKRLSADWIIRDDGDCWPNPILKREARTLFETIAVPMMTVFRLYLWGSDQYFPKYNKPGPSLWAWQPKLVDVRCDESDHRKQGIRWDGTPLECVLERPFAVLHNTFPDEETVIKKMARKKAFGRNLIHPLESQYAPPEPLPSWVLHSP